MMVAMQAAVGLVEEETYASAVVVESRLPMHTSRFDPVAAALRPALERTPWRPPARPYVPNVLGRFVEQPSYAQIVDLLCRHVSQPVLWRQSIDAILARDPETVFVEVGPGVALTNLLPRTVPKARRLATDAEAPGFAALVATLQGLRRGV